jgi:hypothetical protein
MITLGELNASLLAVVILFILTNVNDNIVGILSSPSGTANAIFQKYAEARRKFLNDFLLECLVELGI